MNKPVRLTQSEIQGIKEAINNFTSKNESKLYLYGSRCDLNRKGGDIDLLLVVTSSQIKQKLLEKKHCLTAEIKQNIGDQKVDLLITAQEEISTDPFLQSILPMSVLL